MFRNDFAQSPAPQVQVRTPLVQSKFIYVCMCIYTYIYTNVKTWPTFLQARDDQVRHHKHRSRGLHKYSHGKPMTTSKWLILTDKLWTRKTPPIHPSAFGRGFHHGFYGPVLLRRLSSPLSQPSEWRSPSTWRSRRSRFGGLVFQHINCCDVNTSMNYLSRQSNLAVGNPLQIKVWMGKSSN
jgi:hypothetical protein